MVVRQTMSEQKTKVEFLGGENQGSRYQPIDVENCVRANDDRIAADEDFNANLQFREIILDDELKSNHPAQHDKPHQHHHVPEPYDGYIQFIPFFRIIRQRQRWGEKQERPHSDFSDTFIDLFFVAAAYNLGWILCDSISAIGLLYFLGCFLPLQQIWTHNIAFDSRFYYITPDVIHQMHEKAGLIALATAILSIRPVAAMSNPSRYIDMFFFSIGLLCTYLLSILRHIEVMICTRYCERQRIIHKKSNSTARASAEFSEMLTALFPEAFGSSLRQLGLETIPCAFYLVAAIYSGLKYYGTGNLAEIEVRRDLAADESSNKDSTPDHLPISLILGGAVSCILSGWYLYLFHVQRTPNARDHAVPLNIDHIIHRHGEWIMLVLGESVLSLLIVDTPDDAYDYFVTFVFGILSIVMLQYLHFRSHPRDPDHHALRRHIKNGLMYNTLLQIYSTSLVVLGASYKMLLYEYVYSEAPSATTSAALNFDVVQRTQRVAYFFSASMATVFLCLDGIIFSHQGFQIREARCRETRTLQIVGISLALSRLLLIVFVASMGLYITKPRAVAGAGLGSILVQILIWEIDSRVFFPNDTFPEPQ